jgi:hypothetical protein
MNIETATETELRGFLADNGIVDHEFVYHYHPLSKSLRDAGFHEQADVLDDYYRKFIVFSMGEPRVLTLEEIRARAKEILDAEHK